MGNKKVLFITTRNVYSTCGELRLIKNRTITLLNEYGISTDFLVIKRKKILQKKQEMIPNSLFELRTFGFTSYFTTLKHIECRALTLIRENDYQCVIISGGLLHLIPLIKKSSPSLKCIYDIHGTNKELIEFNTESIFVNITRKLLYLSAVYNEKRYLKFFDGFLVVSHSLELSIKNKYAINNDNFFIVPCAVSNDIPSVDELKKMRKEARNHYQISENENLFIYSGGVSSWQNIDKSVKLFKDINKQTSHKCKMLILSGNLRAILKYKEENILIDSLSADDVQKVICAGDYAFMLRGDFATNNVAFPNKFLEYVASGMNIIATPYVYDVRDYIKEYDLGIIIPDDTSKIDWSYFDKQVAYPSNYDSRKQLVCRTSFKNTLKPLVEFIEK